MKILRSLATLLRRRDIDAEMRAEMEAHLAMQAELNRSAGLPADEADFAARRQFGNVAIIQETAREQRAWRWWHQLGQDLGHTARQFRREPALTATILFT